MPKFIISWDAGGLGRPAKIICAGTQAEADDYAGVHEQVLLDLGATIRGDIRAQPYTAELAKELGLGGVPWDMKIQD